MLLFCFNQDILTWWSHDVFLRVCGSKWGICAYIIVQLLGRSIQYSTLLMYFLASVKELNQTSLLSNFSHPTNR